MRISLADALAATGRVGEAEAQIDRALELDGSSERALVLKGELRRTRGFPEDALTYFDRALELGGRKTADRPDLGPRRSGTRRGRAG